MIDRFATFDLILAEDVYIYVPLMFPRKYMLSKTRFVIDKWNLVLFGNCKRIFWNKYHHNNYIVTTVKCLS